MGGKVKSAFRWSGFVCGCDCRHLQQACWAYPYHGAGFGEALVGPGCSQRGQTGMAGPLGFRCPGSSYWVLLAQLKDWNRCNSGNRTGSLGGQHQLSSVLFSSRETDSRDSVNGRIESTERNRLGYSVFRDALLRKWVLGDHRVSLPSSPPSLGCFLAKLKRSRTLAGFFANQCGGKNEIPPMEWWLDLRCELSCLVGSGDKGTWQNALETGWPVAALQAQWGLNKGHDRNYTSVCCKRNYFRAPIY